MKQIDGATKLDQVEASKNLRHFLNRFNKKAFGNGFYRYGRKALVISMLEKTYAGRWHYHLALKNPFSDLDICGSTIEGCWAKTRWGYREIDIQPMHSDGWISYITKGPSTDGWDVENTHLAR